MNDYIRDIVQKMDAIVDVLNDIHPARTLDIINYERVNLISPGALSRKHVIQALGMAEANANAWAKYNQAPNQGFAIMLAQLAGFGPTDTTMGGVSKSCWCEGVAGVRAAA